MRPLLPFVPLVERSLLHDRQSLQLLLRGVGGRMVLARTSRGARTHGR